MKCIRIILGGRLAKINNQIFIHTWSNAWEIRFNYSNLLMSKICPVKYATSLVVSCIIGRESSSYTTFERDAEKCGEAVRGNGQKLEEKQPQNEFRDESFKYVNATKNQQNFLTWISYPRNLLYPEIVHNDYELWMNQPLYFDFQKETTIRLLINAVVEITWKERDSSLLGSWFVKTCQIKNNCRNFIQKKKCTKKDTSSKIFMQKSRLLLPGNIKNISQERDLEVICISTVLKYL